MQAPLTGFAVNTYSWTQRSHATDCVDRLADLGVAAFEVMLFPGHLWPDDTVGIERLARLAARRNLSIATLNMPNIDVNIGAAAEEMRRHSLGLLTRFIETAGAVGAQGLVIGPGKANPLMGLPRPVLRDHLFAALDRLLPCAEAAGVSLYVENMPVAFLPRAAELAATLDAYGADQVKLCYDVTNAHFIGEDPADGLGDALPRLALLHVSDTGRAVYRHDPIGLGDMDFAAIAAAVRASGWAGPTALEIVSAEPETDFPASAALLKERGWPV